MEKILVSIDNMLRTDFIQEAFNGIAVYRADLEEQKVKKFHDDIELNFVSLSTELKEATLSLYLVKCKDTNLHQLKLLLSTLEKLVKINILSPRLICEQILSCDKLDYKNELFWIECFRLIKRIIGGVDYKGVREIMKGCREKASSFPKELNSNVLPQMLSLCEVLQYIFNRNSCLLPAYFIITEIQKPDNVEVHWKIANLTTNFVEEFVNLAQMLSIIGHSSMYPIVEHTGYADNNPWRLEPNTLKFTLRGNLPYDVDLTQAQTGLLRYVLNQPYSRDMVCSMLNLQKQRCSALEEQLVWLLISAMEKSEQDAIEIENAVCSPDDVKRKSNDATPSTWLWLHLSSQLIYFVLFQCATFPNIVNALHEKLLTKDLRKGREDLFWSLLQYISGSIQRNALSNFLPVLKLYDILYPERQPLDVPDVEKKNSVKQISACCIYIHLLKKAQLENINLRPIPIALKKHYEFLQHLTNTQNLSIGDDYIVALLCNAYSTNQEFFSRPMGAIIDTILGTNKTTQPQSTQQQQQPLPTIPLSMCILDSLTVHSKMSVIHCIVNHMMKQAETKSSIPNISTNISPALVETYSRLLVYTEIESLGIKGFLSRLLPTVFKSNAWGILYTLLEMFSYRIFHIQPHYRAQLLSHLHSLASAAHTNQMQLHLCVESTALRLITGLDWIQLGRFLTEPKNLQSIVSVESEELNRVLILTLARSIHITGAGGSETIGNTSGSGNLSYLKDLLNTIMANTPHTWNSNTRQCFPKILADYFANHSHPVEDKQLLKKSVEEEQRNWVTMTNENDILAYFSQTPLFLCLLFKMILETNEISPLAYKILERIGSRALSAHLRKLCDYIVFEVTNNSAKQSGSNAKAHQVNKLVDTINDLIWKYNVVTIDRLVLCLALRTQERIQEAQVCFYVIQLLLIKTSEFRDRVQKFVEENSPEYWKQNNWNEKHLAFHQKFPEKYVPSDESSIHTALPVFFGNVCLRFLPVLDIVIHRYLEVPVDAVIQSLESLLKSLGLLYKFHDRPITYLYNTLHYYEHKLRDRPTLKRKLVGAVILSQEKEKNWALTEQYLMFIDNHLPEDTLGGQNPNAIKWNPELSYYINLVRRLIDTVDGKNDMFPNVDWRFNEFPNPSTHCLYVTCVELLGLPAGPVVVANNIIDVVIKGLTIISYQHIHKWINAIGLIMSTLPECYWSVIFNRLEDILRLPQMTEWTYRQTPFDMFNFKTVKQALLEKNYVMVLAIAHSIFHHFSIGQTAKIINYVKEKLKPHIKTEPQLVYLHHIIGPFLQRLDPKDVLEITKIYYELLELVDKSIQDKNDNQAMKYMDSICDMLYHMKYMYVGDAMKNDLEPIIRRLSAPLKLRLRFITRLSVEDLKAEKSLEPAAIKSCLKQQPISRM